MIENGKMDSEPESATQSAKLFPKVFWGTIYIMMAVTTGLLVLGLLNTNSSKQDSSLLSNFLRSFSPHAIEIESTVLRRYFTEANQVAFDIATNEIDKHLDDLYAPVYAGIAAYSDFHYSIWGEYTELAAAVAGQMGDNIEKYMFEGFGERLDTLSSRLDTTYSDTFLNSLTTSLESELPPGISVQSFGSLTSAAIEDAVSRAQVTVPVGTATASVGGFAMAKIMSKKIASKLFAKIAMKTSAKFFAKGAGSILVGSFAAAGSVFGPVGTVAGAVVGGVATWFAADAVIIRLDEYFNRTDFENELKLIVDENKAELKVVLLNAMAAKKIDMDEFTLRELGQRAGS